jgi:hypothetical protein
MYPNLENSCSQNICFIILHMLVLLMFTDSRQKADHSTEFLLKKV